MSMRLFDSAAGQLREFAPANPDLVTMYVCGPTVYGQPHVGNARAVVAFDVLYRLLRSRFAKVRYARNITDIDDKIIAAAGQAQVEVDEWARQCAVWFHEVMEQLGTLAPDLQPRATEHIDTMIAMIEKLVAAGNAYVADGHVLFEVASYPAYGSLSNRSRDEMIAGARVEVAPYKRSPEDFVLWKPSRPEQPGWESPWGRGRPGWHIECSAMVKECLGETIDIHGGGNDLLFPHHENESAQSCCANGCEQLARFWVHNGQVTAGGRKMAKSAGNFFTVKDVLQEYPGEVIRYALLSSHYRRPLEWGEGLLAQSKASLDRLYRSLAGAGQPAADAEPAAELLAALADDLNTPQAFAVLHELAARANRAGSGQAAAAGELLASGRFLGLLESDPAAWLQESATGGGMAAAEIEQLIGKREQARSRGDYETADRIRQQLDDAGVAVEDGAGGSSWRRR